MQVVDLMSVDLVSVTRNTLLRDAARLMVRHRISGLPVLDDGKLVGMVTEGDFLRLEVEHGVGNERSGAQVVGELMSAPVVTVPPDLSLPEAAALMCEADVKRLPVLDEDGRMLGIISRSDVVTAFTRPDEVIDDEIREDVIRRALMLDPDDFTIEVQQGRVRLAGSLSTRGEASLLVEVVTRLDGVMNVESELNWDDPSV